MSRRISSLKLGKQPPRQDSRTLLMATYLDTAVLPAPPPALDLTSKVPAWPMYGNDRLGDCTCAAAGHMIELWTAMLGREQSVSTATITKAYRKLSPQDQGCVELDVLNYWRETGFTAKHKLYAFAAVDPRLTDHAKLALALFGGVYLGIALPTSAQRQTGPGKVWDVADGAAGAPGSWGGHAVNVVAYDATTVTVVTWGALQRMTWAFWAKYVEEAWCLLTQDWSKGVPIPGFNFQALAADLAAVGRKA